MVAAGVLVLWVARDRSAPDRAAGGAARRAGGARRAAADEHRGRRRPSAARSSIATAGCSPTASTPTPSTPSRPRSPMRRRPRPRCATRWTTARRSRVKSCASGCRRARAFVYVRRRATPMQAKRVAALELDGIGFRKESKRYYPNRELAAHLLGYVGVDNVGLGGIEATYDKTVRGREGKLLVQTDARRHVFSRLERSPTAGASIELTIDEQLQHIAEREVRAGVRGGARRRRHRRDHGSAHRRDPRDGELADVQSERLQRRAGNGAAQSRRAGPLRARIDVQARHRIGGDRREGDQAGRHHRRQRRHDPLRQPRDRRHAPLRSAVVRRRDRQVEQRRRDQGRTRGSAPSAWASTSAASASAVRRRRIFRARAPASCGSRRS